MELEDLGEQLYNLLAQVLNRPENRAFFDSIRGCQCGGIKGKTSCCSGENDGYTHGIGEKGTYYKTEK